ncbi:hypothetical protein ACVIM9_001656 [Bradyrhizobium sp. USDA 4520]
MPSGANPMNHCDQPTSMLTSFLAIESAAAFGASAVRNSELVTAVVANAVHITKVPILPAVGPGSEP